MAQTAECPPPECGQNPQYFCDEVTDFYYAMIPSGVNQFNIYAISDLSLNVDKHFFLMSGNTLVGAKKGSSVVFEDVPYGCYRLVICTDGEADYYCCVDLPCEHFDFGCCELRFPFYTNLPNPVWQFGDNTGSTAHIAVHEYTNLNTYPLEGTPQALIQLSWGNNTIQNTLDFPPGIWVGMDCHDSGSSSAIQNSINPALSVFPSLSYADRRISVKGSIDMNQNYQFSNCDFCMHPASRIVSMASPLSFTANTQLHEAECKDRAWYGVELRQGTLLGDQATFTGAYNAVRVPAGLGVTPVGRFSACYFNRNYLGINLAGPMTFGTFSGNTFGSVAALDAWPGLSAGACSWVSFIDKPVDPAPFAGIYARTPAGGSIVSVNLPANAVQPNVFVNLSSGVYLNDANAFVRRCRFQNMLSGAYPNDDGFGVALFTRNSRTLRQEGLGKFNNALSFDNCRHAVYVEVPQNSGANVLVRSLNNRMHVQHAHTLRGGFSAFSTGSLIRNNDITFTGERGIDVENTSANTRLEISGNRVEAVFDSAIGIYLHNFDAVGLGGDYRISVLNNTGGNDGIFGGSDGIDIGLLSNVLVENNTISGFNRFGIFNVESPEVDLRCNTVSSSAGTAALYTHFSSGGRLEYNYTDASPDGIRVSSICSNSVIRCNQIGSHDNGLYYDGTAVTGNQLSGGLSAGNTWNGNYTNWAAYCAGPNYINSRYFYRPGEINPMQIFPQPPIPNDWFREVSMGITCSEACPVDESAEREVTELDNAVADESLNPGGLPGYLLKRFLYKDLLYYPQLLQGNTNLQNYQNSFDNTNGGKLVSAEKATSDGFRLPAPQQSQWDAALNDLNAAFEQWNELDSLLQNGADPAAQETERGTLTQQFSTTQTALQSIYQDNLTARINSVAAIQQTLDGVNPAAVWESNEKTLDSIFLHTAYIDGVPNSVQTGQILQIAEQCSADGGPAVFRAKAWYFSLTGTRVEVNCGGEIERGSNDKALPETTGTLAVSPNPATNMLLVRWTEPLPETSTLKIFDLNGVLKDVIIVPEQATSIPISLADLQSGMYFCQLKNNKQTLKTTRFIIQN